VARRIESFSLRGPAGRLEALLEEPEDGRPTDAAIVCHPHPKYGGTMRNKVVHRLARGLRVTGSAVLRFNFRGVHLSEGAYDHGNGEVEDARAALEWLRNRYPELPFTLAGFSFGSRVALQLGCDHEDTSRIVAVGFPVKWGSQIPTACRVPRSFIQSTGDEYSPRDEMQHWFDGLDGPKRILWVAAKDHFFGGALDLFEETVARL
jgi:alpha/beta superfamily hydrolase